MAKVAATYESILADVKSRQFKPIYFVYGDEPYYIDRISERFEKDILTDEEKEFNYRLMYGKDIQNAAAIVDEARQFPMFSDYRLVIVKEAQNIEDWDTLSLYLDHPSDKTILLICYRSEKLDARRKVFKDISAKGAMFQSKALYDSQISPWIADYVRTAGYRIDPRTADLMASHIGSKLDRLANELNKLFIVMEQQKVNTITPEMVERNIGISKEFNNFELVKAISTGNVLLANQIVNYFGANPKENPPVVTAIVLFRYFADLMTCLQKRVTDANGIKNAFGKNYYQALDLEHGAQRYNSMKTLEIIGLLREMDARFKGFGSGKISEQDLLRETIYKIMH